VRPPHGLPDLLVDEGARRLALGYLGDATTARARVTGTPDPEALHDYRVALRRLRSCLRAYRKAVHSSVTDQTVRRLGRLARGTNRSRDLEVHLAWLAARRCGAGEAAQPGIAWTMARLAAAKVAAWKDMLELDAALFPGIHARLVSRLTRFRATIDLDAGALRRSTAAVTARRVHRAAHRLQDRLGRIQAQSDDVAIHRARISAKHLRYLLEPFAPALPEGESAVERLKALQDGLGEVHDGRLFEAELRDALPDARQAPPAGPGPVPGIEALLAALEARGSRAFEEAAKAWLGEAPVPFFLTVARLADAIAGLAERDREVERKFLLRALPPLPNAQQPVDIEQGYLPGERLVERLRRIRSSDGVTLVRTVKEGSGLTRLEVEEAVSPDMFERLWPLTEGRRIHKRRYRVPDGDLTWEIDEFLDRDLVLAEVELVGRPVTVELPAWLRPAVEREVTEEEEYSNVQLALHPPAHA
jgi:CHAD domain-containing protein/CYTH domain-containing protein